MAEKRTAELFSDAEQHRIREAVAAAEATTAGEIATMVVPRSDSYGEAALLGSLLAAALLATAVGVASGHTSLWSHIPLTVLFFPLFLFLFRRFPRLTLALVSGRRRQEAVRERAVRAFFEQGLHRTRDETGILVFISLLEHKVWILGDRGINEKIPLQEWQELARELSRGIGEGRACDALCRTIELCGQELSLHFPRRGDDRNELSDELLRESHP